MGRWGKKRWPSQEKDTVSGTWVTSSNTQLLSFSGVFNFWTTKLLLWYRNYLQSSQQTYLHIFFKSVEFCENNSSDLTNYYFYAYEAEKEKWLKWILKVWSFPSVDQSYMFVWLKSLETRDGQVGCWYTKPDVLDQDVPVHNQGLEWIFIWIWCIYFSWKDFWMSRTFQRIVYRHM